MFVLFGVLQLTILVALAAVQVRANAALFGVDQSGKYWGAKIDLSASSSNVKFELYPEFSQSTGSVSYDPVTGQSLFELYKPHAIAYGPMCSNSHGFRPQVLFNISDIMVDRPDIGTSIVGKISAFAMYNSNIYFLHYGSYLTEEQHVFHIFQIRKFQSCEVCNKDPYLKDPSNSPFSLTFSVECSEMVTEAVSLSSEQDEDIFNYEFHGGKSLKVAKRAGSEELDFYFQIGMVELSDSGSSSVKMILHRASSSGSTEEIHSQDVNERFFEWTMYAIGSVDYKDGLLCWTTGERLHCREDGGETNEIIRQTDVITYGVCNGRDPGHIMDVSGVSIIKNRDNTQVIAFGCNPSSSSISGAGLITINDGQKSVEPLKAGEKALSAGSVVTVQALQETCSYDPRPMVCVRLQRTTMPPPTTSAEAEPTSRPEDGKGEPEVEPGNGIDDNNQVEGKPVSGSDNGSGANELSHNWLLLFNTLLVTALALILS